MTQNLETYTKLLLFLIIFKLILIFWIFSVLPIHSIKLNFNFNFFFFKGLLNFPEKLYGLF